MHVNVDGCTFMQKVFFCFCLSVHASQLSPVSDDAFNKLQWPFYSIPPRPNAVLCATLHLPDSCHGDHNYTIEMAEEYCLESVCVCEST